MSDEEKKPRPPQRRGGKRKTAKARAKTLREKGVRIESRSRAGSEPVRKMREDAERAALKERMIELVAEQQMSMTGAAKAAGIGRQTLYNWRAADPEFERALIDAYEAGTDLLEDEAHRRARKSEYLLIECLRRRRAAWRKHQPVAPQPVIVAPDDGVLRRALARLPAHLVDAIVEEMERLRAEDAAAAAAM